MRALRWPFAIAALAALSLGAAGRAWADPPEADIHIARGLALRTEQQDLEALAEFEEAYRIAPTPRAMAQRGLAEQALGRWRAADQHLRDALQAKGDDWIDRYRGALDQSVADVGRHLATVLAFANVPAGELWIDGERVATLPMREAVRWPAGSVVLEIRAAGYLAARRTRALEAGEAATESFTLAREGDTRPAPAPAAPPPPRRLDGERAAPKATGAPAGAWVVAGAGVLALGGGLALGAAALSAKGDVSRPCLDRGVCGPDRATLDDAHRDATWSTVLVTAGLAAVATGAVWLLWPRGSPARRGAAVRPTGPGLELRAAF